MEQRRFGHIIKEKNEIKRKMVEVQKKIIQEGRSDERVQEGLLINNIEERRKHEEILWKKKSRVQWL